MSLLILVQILLVGLRVTGTTTDTWRQCKGILILMSTHFTSLGSSCNNYNKNHGTVMGQHTVYYEEYIGLVLLLCPIGFAVLLLIFLNGSGIYFLTSAPPKASCSYTRLGVNHAWQALIESQNVETMPL